MEVMDGNIREDTTYIVNHSLRVAASLGVPDAEIQDLHAKLRWLQQRVNELRSLRTSLAAQMKGDIYDTIALDRLTEQFAKVPSEAEPPPL